MERENKGRCRKIDGGGEREGKGRELLRGKGDGWGTK